VGQITDRFAVTFRDYATDGIPASGDHDPVKANIRALGNTSEIAIENIALSATIAGAYPTQAALYADLAYPANALAMVYSDPDPRKSGVYIKTGGTGAGAWVQTDIPYGAAAAVVQPLLDQTEDARDAAVAAAAQIVGTQFPFPTTDLFTFTDANEKIVAVIDQQGNLQLIGNGGGGGNTSTKRFRFYTFDGSNVFAETLKAYEGTDGLNFPTELPIVFNPPAGQTVRDPDIFRDAVTGIWWMVYSAWSFGTGAAAASFGVARSADGENWTYVGLIDLGNVPDPANAGGKADRAWAPAWVFDGMGGVFVWVSSNFGAIDPATGGSRMTPLLFRVTSPDMKRMEYLGTVTGTKIPFNCIDGTAIRTNGVYLACVKDEAARQLHIVWSKDLRTGYNDEGSTATALWGEPIEGPTLLGMEDGRIRCYYDRYNGSGMFCRDSVDGGVTWGAEMAVVAATERHGSVLIY